MSTVNDFCTSRGPSSKTLTVQTAAACKRNLGRSTMISSRAPGSCCFLEKKNRQQQIIFWIVQAFSALRVLLAQPQRLKASKTMSALEVMK